ncbi:unnamed protein product [marine sediment metagenome]|uniref:Uncharacterized protein n=1 Tax=marine sediment metagenome TaxID=412755 RepID=X1PTB1_9ZZZZ
MAELGLVLELTKFLAEVQRLCEGGDGEGRGLSGTISFSVDCY